MATVPFKKPAGAQPGATGPEDPLLKEMRRLVARAKLDRNQHQARIADCYRYAMPWRHKFGANQPGNQFDEVFDETIGTVLEDFAADMLNTFTPQKNNWLEEGPAEHFETEGARAGTMRQIKDMLEGRQRVIFAEMGRSSLYPALQEGYMDLGPGTMCLLIQDLVRTKPIHCEAIPSTDLLLARGPYGTVDVFREKQYLWGEVKVLWPDAEMDKLGEPPADPNARELTVIDGCWRDWGERGTITYHYMVEADGKRIFYKKYEGEGSCPFIVARWSRDSTTAWGVGPTYRTLPAIKTLNHIRYLDLKNYDKYVDPPTAFMDDGVLNVDHGVGPGDWIPVAVGSDFPQTIESKAKLDLSVFEREELRSTIKRAHYQDRPEQLGKTPPTAFQWSDERAERARRMGTPATNLVIELQIPIYMRFSYLLAERNVLPRVVLNGQEVALQATSPLLRAQEQEEVLRMDRFAEMITVRFGPQIANIIINQFKHAEDLAKLMDYDTKRLRSESDIAAAIEQLLPVLQAGRAAAGGGEIAPPPVGVL